MYNSDFVVYGLYNNCKGLYWYYSHIKIDKIIVDENNNITKKSANLYRGYIMKELEGVFC